MKNSWLVLSFLILICSCKKKENQKEKISPKKLDSKNYAILSGVIKNSEQDYFILFGKQINQKIELAQDGSFKDSIEINVITTNGIRVNKIQIPIYLKKGYSINIEADANNFAKSLTYKGIGAKENNYLLAQYKYGLEQGKKSGKDIYSLSEDNFKKTIALYKTGLDSIDNFYKNIDKDLLEFTKKQNTKSIGFIQNIYNTTKNKIKLQKEALSKLVKGTPSPKFINYENLNGELISLDDFRGNYVFVEIWGTWIKEYTENALLLNTFKKKHNYKNLKFITLCADNKASSGTIRFAKQKWKDAINKNGLMGKHLFVGNEREFLQKYQVSNLPRYILIDPKGNIIDAQAPSPTSPKLTKLFKTLNLK